ncbi:alpha/beta fold hydrolase [Bombilactobacillus folatiphilus]|uniref:Alpha/beta fold hydrolase n=1 Tax=Bombilactobacillus folatiphilus TaxID=2923362 RepID=A0ABY4P813_9LACO|nr:alpha/beta fold hydrolase [Bombilactobacillus folatiphilus]UQS81661.1 alpha/beta fold hydrolase [Bombilactobacillus folatiphilus]
MRRVPPQTFFVDQGERTIIFLHSFTGSPNDFRAFSRYFAKKNVSSYLPLFQGHGTLNSLDILRQGDPDQWWSNTQKALEFVFQRKTGPVSVVGLSLGSLFALKALAHYPQLESGAVLGCPVFGSDFTNVGAGFYQYNEYLEQQQELTLIQKKQRKRLIEQLLPQMLAQIQQTAMDVQAQLSQIKQPLFIGHGQKDQMVALSAAKKLQTRFPLQQVSFHCYPNAGHVITVNQARAQLEQDLSQFLL